MNLLTLKSRIFSLSFMSLFSMGAVLAHGDDKFGPHGGFVRMPGAFHTEVLKKGSNLRVYLLDINWKNPVTSGTVEASIKRGESESKLECKSSKNYFLCSLPKGEGLQSGDLIIKSKRETFPEGVATYSLPLSLTKTVDAHNSHH